MKHALTVLAALLLAPLAALHAAERTLLKHTGQVIELVGDRDALSVADKPGMLRSTPDARPPRALGTWCASASFVTDVSC